MKLIIKGIVSLTGIICVAHILCTCLDHGINGTIIASGLTLTGFFVGLIFDISVKRK